MPARKEIDGSASIPAFYGKELRWKREKAGRTLMELVEGSYFGASYLSEIERGQRCMPEQLAHHVDKVLDTDGFFERRCEDARNARKAADAGYFARVKELEESARDVDTWNPNLIPGPLQLEPYIRAVVHAAHPSDAEETVAAKVAARRERAWLYEDPKSPETWMVLSESVLRQPIIGDDEMGEQLAHIVEVAQRGRFIPQVLLSNAGAHPFMMGETLLLTFGDAPPVMYTEGMYTGHLVDDPELVRQYAKAYDRLRATALPPKESLKMIEKAAEDYRNGKRPR
ncbi:helix-turn-helix domain-containing protein [Streptomyces chattanoogensis]|uniref:helix-turn-helix domain-containing protein n=1 Tax=Streptomyces chattanoogensis TaxID=66876 RepID=UPI0005D8E2F4|nr:hypothetical protein T261_4561 [Streptomyces lydicus]